MSMPLWKRNVPGPARPFARRSFAKIVRGSPKLPRMGCCWLNGLIGQGYAEARGAAKSETPAKMEMTSKRKRMAGGTTSTGGRLVPRAAATDGVIEHADRRPAPAGASAGLRAAHGF